MYHYFKGAYTELGQYNGNKIIENLKMQQHAENTYSIYESMRNFQTWRRKLLF